MTATDPSGRFYTILRTTVVLPEPVPPAIPIIIINYSLLLIIAKIILSSKNMRK
jgi:hypothetical protein